MGVVDCGGELLKPGGLLLVLVGGLKPGGGKSCSEWRSDVEGGGVGGGGCDFRYFFKSCLSLTTGSVSVAAEMACRFKRLLMLATCSSSPWLCSFYYVKSKLVDLFQKLQMDF